MLTTAQQVRLRIQDQPKLARDTYTADGAATGFSLPHRNITSASAYVMNAGAWSATGAMFSVSGEVAFADAISAQSAFQVAYTYSVFSDEEIADFVTAGGGIPGARLEAVQALMFDGLKRSRWMAADGTQFDDTQAMSLLNRMYDQFSKEAENDALLGGGLISWAGNQ
jgi:hypothetical protein